MKEITFRETTISCPYQGSVYREKSGQKGEKLQIWKVFDRWTAIYDSSVTFIPLVFSFRVYCRPLYSKSMQFFIYFRPTTHFLALKS